MQNAANIQTQSEIKVNVRDLWLNILLHWRWVVIIAALAGILGLGLSIVSAHRESKAAIESPIELTPEIEEKYKNMDALQASYDEQQTYLAESSLMNIDPLHKWVYTAQFYIVMSPDLSVQPNINAVIAQYLTAVQSEQTCEAIRSALNEDIASSYITELITTANMGSNYFSFSVSSDNANDAQEMGDAINSIVTAAMPAVTKNFGAHTLTMNGSSCHEMVDSDLMNSQKMKINDAQSTLNNITSIRDGFTDEEQEILEAYEAVQDGSASTGKVNVVTAILFFIGGALLSLFMLLIHYIFSDRLHSADTLWQDNHIYDMGIISDRKNKKTSAIDTFLIKTFSPYLYRMLSTDPAIVAYRLKDTASNANVQTLYVTSSMAEAQIEDALKKLTEALADTDLSVTFLPNIVYDTIAFQAACQEGSILLLEQSGSSYREEVLRVVDTCRNHQIKILGAVTWVTV